MTQPPTKESVSQTADLAGCGNVTRTAVVPFGAGGGERKKRHIHALIDLAIPQFCEEFTSRKDSKPFLSAAHLGQFSAVAIRYVFLFKSANNSLGSMTSPHHCREDKAEARES